MQEAQVWTPKTPTWAQKYRYLQKAQARLQEILVRPSGFSSWQSVILEPIFLETWANESHLFRNVHTALLVAGNAAEHGGKRRHQKHVVYEFTKRIFRVKSFTNVPNIYLFSKYKSLSLPPFIHPLFFLPSVFLLISLSLFVHTSTSLSCLFCLTQGKKRNFFLCYLSCSTACIIECGQYNSQSTVKVSLSQTSAINHAVCIRPSPSLPLSSLCFFFPLFVSPSLSVCSYVHLTFLFVLSDSGKEIKQALFVLSLLLHSLYQSLVNIAVNPLSMYVPCKLQQSIMQFV